MTKDSVEVKYIEDLNSLERIIDESNARLLCDHPDDFFLKNVNFLVKSYLVTICAFLESFLKDLVVSYVDDVNERLFCAAVPSNLVKWSINKDKALKEKDSCFNDLKIQIDKKTLDEHVSGNPFRTEKLFELIGFDLKNNSEYKSFRDVINTIVNKRNKILHHNDQASDISLNDVAGYVKIVKEYIEVLTRALP